jgi:hypothetical protein
MKLKAIIPEDISDISLSQYQEYEALNDKLIDESIDADEYNKQKISLFSGIPYNRMGQVSYKDFASLLSDIDKALEQECKFVDRFFLDGIEFGFIPNFDKIASKEYFDLQAYSKELETGKGMPVETLHSLMAVLFRPVKQKDIDYGLMSLLFKPKNKPTNKLKNYNIKEYNGTEKYGELMKQTPMHIVKGAIVFFLSLSKELQRHIQKCTAEAQAKERKQVTSLANGDGMTPSTL